MLLPKPRGMEASKVDITMESVRTVFGKDDYQFEYKFSIGPGWRVALGHADVVNCAASATSQVTHLALALAALTWLSP